MFHIEYSESNEPNKTNIKLGQEYKVFLNTGEKTVIAIDGEKYLGQIGLSEGFIHFLDPITKKSLGFSGTYWFEKNAKEVL